MAVLVVSSASCRSCIFEERVAIFSIARVMRWLRRKEVCLENLATLSAGSAVAMEEEDAV